jgi:hypothetical protein
MSASMPEGLLERIRAEYLEMPGWCLTLEQMQRLNSVERTLCKRVLDALVDSMRNAIIEWSLLVVVLMVALLVVLNFLVPYR